MADYRNWSHLLFQSHFHWDIPDTSEPLAPSDNAISEVSLTQWLPAVPARFGGFGARLAYAFALHSRHRYKECVYELDLLAAVPHQDVTQSDLIVMFLLRADALLLANDQMGSLHALRAAYDASRHYSIDANDRRSILILIAEALLQLDLPSIAEEILSINLSAPAARPATEHYLASVVMEWAQVLSREDMSDIGRVTLPMKSINTFNLNDLPSIQRTRLRRLLGLSPSSRATTVIGARLIAKAKIGSDLIELTSALNSHLTIGMQRALYTAIQRKGDDDSGLDVIALHYLYNDILDSPNKRLAHLAWMQGPDQTLMPDTLTTHDINEADILELLDAATRQESMLRDEYSSLNSKIDVLLARIKETEALRADLSVPFARIENDITTLIAVSQQDSDAIEVRLQLQRTSEAIQRDIEDLLRRINKRPAR